ncbi:MAG: FeoB-associated Cys-rich membrane protein [Clostridia bacterium]|nr:FeoB-associated Cys-rich membrane protein [Clostridia bacterium]MBQ7051676.1 FeoB-associated Cys-rich membrane protein [Clostridia bacterium]
MTGKEFAMVNFVVILILALIIGAASLYIYKEKKRGVVCVGCPHACMRDPKTGEYVGGGCSGKCSGCPGSCGR